MRRIAVFLFAALTTLAALPVLAQETYPNRAITLVTPYPAAAAIS
jgi:tripartite-type tricarboxylate transporter receptor subunit TctC